MNTINNRIALMIVMAVIVLLGWLTPSLAKSVIAPDLVHPSRDRTTDYQLAQTAPRLAQSTTQKGSQPSNIPTSLYSVHTAGIPTARNVDHVGLTVPDLNQALTFFVDVLGADVLWVEPEGYGTQRPPCSATDK
ncbi:MAG: VOC family protein [Chroococcidiopsidaceae cyanobacterium CP_BM_RX_35]|nr:VOC family protein [Chroococcidiopsidaceae cyanobacterium CP_BM_RX_35]